MPPIRPLLLALLTTSLAACASTPAPAQPGLAQIHNQVEFARDDLAERARLSASSFEQVDEVWLGAVAVERGADEPAIFSRPAEFMRFYPVSLHDIANYITQTFDLRVTVSEDALESMYATSGGRQNGMSATSMMGGGAVPPPIGGQLPSVGAGGMGGMGGVGGMNGMQSMGNANTGGLMINYAGNLRGFLDTVAAQSGTAWRHTDGRIEIYALDTRVFTVNVLPSPSSVQAEITSQTSGGNGGMGGGGGTGGGGGGGSGGSGGESGSTQIGGSSSTASNIEIDPFTAIVDSVQGMLSPSGNVTAAAPLGQIVVTDRPAILDRVSSYIDQANIVATRQVALEVRMYVVEGKRSDGHAISWDMVWNSLSSRAGVNLVGGGSPSGGPSLGVTILDSDSPFSGSRLFLDALSEQANVEQLTSATAITLSGRPVPFQVTEDVGYLESSQVSLVPDVGMQTTINQGRTTTGFTMTLLPLMSGDDILMQATISLRSLRELRRLGTDQQGNVYETPLTDLRQVMQHMHLRSGQTAIMTGFEQETLRSNATGVGSPRFRLLGGAKEDEKRTTSLVIMITPKVVS